MVEYTGKKVILTDKDGGALIPYVDMSSKLDADKVQVVKTLPTSPKNDTLYFIEGDIDTSASNIDYVVETYRSGTDWYRKYKSGWVEQGGIYNYGSLTRDWNAVTIKYPKPFADTNYTLITQAGRNDAATGSINNQSFVTRFTTGAFISEVYGDGNSQYLWWEAKGQGA